MGLTDAGLTVERDDGQSTDLPPTISSTPDPRFVEGTGLTYDFTANVSDDGRSAVTYSLTNVLPNGLTLNTSTGILTYDGIGIPSVSQHQMTATDAVGSAQSDSFDISVFAASDHFWVSFHPSEFESDGTTFTPFIKGHQIRYGTSTGVYTTTVNTYDEAGWEGCTIFPVKGVASGITYYFQVAGVSHAGVVSAWSSESTSVAKASIPKASLTAPTWDRQITSSDLPITLSTPNEKVKFSGSLSASALQITINASGVDLYLGSGYYGDASNASPITMTGGNYSLISLANGSDDAHVYGFHVTQSNVTTNLSEVFEKWRENTGTKIGGGTYISTSAYCVFINEISALGIGLVGNSLTWPIMYDIDATQTYGANVHFVHTGKPGFKMVDLTYSIAGPPTPQYQGFVRDSSGFHANRCVATFASDTDQAVFFNGWGAADRWITNCTATCNGSGGRPFQNDGAAQRNHFLYCKFLCESPNDSTRSNRGFHNRYGSDFISYYECTSTVSDSNSFSMSLGSRDSSFNVQATDIYVVGGAYTSTTSPPGQVRCEGGTDNLRFFEADYFGDSIAIDLGTFATAPDFYSGFSVYAGTFGSSGSFDLEMDASVTGDFVGTSEVRDSFGSGRITGSGTTTGLTVSSPGSFPAYYDASIVLEAPSNVTGVDLFYLPTFQ